MEVGAYFLETPASMPEWQSGITLRLTKVLVIDGVDWKKGLVYQLGKVTAASHSPSKDMQKAALE
jgi:hypothetical protein